MTKESYARENIDHLLGQAGWSVCDLFYVDGKTAGVIEAKKGERRVKEPRTGRPWTFEWSGTLERRKRSPRLA